MQLFSLKLPVIKKNDPLFEIIISTIKKTNNTLLEGDIVVISEKVIATSQGRVVNLSEVKDISEKARKLAKKYDMDERLVELIVRESTMVLGGLPHVLLAETHHFLIANAGIDQSNAGPGNVVLFPANPDKVVKEYREKLKKEFKIKKLGVIISDSRVQPLRRGTVGIAVATAGFEPVEDLRGKPDIFKRPLQITMRAIADDLTSAAQFLLNEADQQTPVVIIRGVNVEFTENPRLSPDMPPEECLFMNIFSKYLLEKEENQD
jgi:coenzyme F420-0:L-glutamate ligase